MNVAVAVLAGGIGSITDYSYAQTNTEKINAIAENTAETNTILDAIRAALEDLAAALPLLSDDLDRLESRIGDMDRFSHWSPQLVPPDDVVDKEGLVLRDHGETPPLQA